MARTEIPSYTINQLVTAAHANTYLKDNEAAHWSLISNMSYECELIEVIERSTDGVFNFTGIPQTFTSLELVMSVRAAASVASTNLRMRFNGDTGTNYDHQSMISSPTTVTADYEVGKTSNLLGVITGNSATAKKFSGVRIFIPNYRRGYQKSAIVTHVSHLDTASIYMYSLHWRSVAAITSILLFVQGTNTFLTGSVCSLFGRL